MYYSKHKRHLYNNTTFDYVIVGQGIAGTCLAFGLLKLGKKVIVVDDGHKSASSLLAGIINPIVFKRLTLSWKANILSPVAKAFYSEMEKIYSVQLLQPAHLFKIFSTNEEKQLWLEKSENPLLGKFLSGDVVDSCGCPSIKSPYGGGWVKNAFHVDTNAWLTSFRSWLKANNMLIEAIVDYNTILPRHNSVQISMTYDTGQACIIAGKIIFCEGHCCVSNPFFKWLPFYPVKGEQITIHAPELKLNCVVTKNIFIASESNDYYVVGATYNWDDITSAPTTTGKEQLLEKVRKITDTEFSVVAHRAGIRPAVKDRRPLLGRHPEHASLFVFNGLGTKGLLLAPYFAESMAEYLETGAEIEKEVNIERFYVR